MAILPMIMGNGGSQYTETSLWTNQSPSSAFAAQEITLSQSMANFKYLAVKYCYSNGNQGTTFTDLYLVDDFKKSTEDDSTAHCIATLGMENTSNQTYVRPIHYKNDTTIKIRVAYRLAVNTSSTTDIIPLEILGLNELDHGKNFDETVLWTNPNPNSAISSPPWDVELSDSMSNYDYIKISYKGINTDAASTLVSQVISYADLVRTTNARFALFALDSANALNARQMRYYDATHFRFGTCSKVGATGNVTTTCIPYQIIGCNFV